MPLVRTPALVLQAFPYSETSKILRLLTPELGVRSVVAKGALRPKSRFGGLLEPFTEGVASFYLKEHRDLHTLSGFDLVRSRQGLARNLDGFAGASLLAEIVIRAGTEEPHPSLFEALRGGWDSIERADDAAPRQAAIFAAAWRVVGLLGFEPRVEACVGCGSELGAGEPVRFDAAAGGVACTRCRPVGRLLDPATLAELRRLSTSAPGAAGAPLRDAGLHRALLRTFLDHQLGHGRPFRSLDLLGLGSSPPARVR